MRFRILGGLGVDDGERVVDLGGPKQRTVLSVLLLEPGRPVSPDRLVDLVWGDAAPSSAETSLQVHISNLRRALEPGRKPRAAPTVLVTRPAGYALLVDRDALDMTRFEDAAAAGHARLEAGDPTAARELLDRALA